MPCMGTTRSESEQAPVQVSSTRRRPATGDSDSFYSTAVNETEEWAQVKILSHLSTVGCPQLETNKTM